MACSLIIAERTTSFETNFKKQSEEALNFPTEDSYNLVQKIEEMAPTDLKESEIQNSYFQNVTWGHDLLRDHQDSEEEKKSHLSGQAGPLNKQERPSAAKKEDQALKPFYPLKKIGIDGEQPIFHYWIVPPLNPSLMHEFEQKGFFEANEGSKDKILDPINKKAACNMRKSVMPFIPPNKREERTYVLLCWMYMWCGTLWQ